MELSDELTRDWLTPERAEALLAEALGVPQAFPWQRRLLRRAFRGHLPRALDLSTGLGKTAAIGIWLLAWATGAKLPRRLVYVVDRRAVVDQATLEAERLRAFVSRHPDLKKALGLRSDQELPISTLRGQHVDNREWLEDPSLPAIIVGTVDMIGSRLLFSGYGVSHKMRPFHAGLLGVDALFLLDEAHLVPPFERLLEAVVRGQAAELGPADTWKEMLPRSWLMSLSATGRDVEDRFGLDADDLKHPVVQQRMAARKALSVHAQVEAKDLAGAMVGELLRRVESAPEEALRLVAFTNRRTDAEKIATEVGRKLKGKVAIELLVGGRRVHERQKVAEWLKTRGYTGAVDAVEGPSILIATSAGEVGVDFDAHHAVMDVVAWERMVQRLGRINRRGAHQSEVVVIPTEADKKMPEVAERLERVQALLSELPALEDAVDASPKSLGDLKSRLGAERIQLASSPAPLHPPLTRAHVDAWAMTSIPEHTGRTNVGPWLRGWEKEEEPQVLAFFRDALPLEGRRLNEGLLEQYLEEAGPHAAERLEVSARELKDWLLKRTEKLLKGTEWKADLRHDPIVVIQGRRGARSLSPDQLMSQDRKRLEESMADATVIIKAGFGGLERGLLEVGAPAPDENSESLDLTQLPPSSPDSRPIVPFRIRELAASDPSQVEGFQPEKTFVIGHDEEGAANRWLQLERRVNELPVTEAGRSVARRAQSLTEHGAWAAKAAADLAIGLELGEPISQALEVATRLHDEGKAAERWQRAFGVKLEDRPLAKSTRGVSQKVLGGYRHEFGSLPRMARDEAYLALSPAQQELALHLVAAHHGRARPTIPIDGGEEPPEILRRRAREVALRFDRLSREFGPWGLAWLESLLRAADVSASKRNDRGGHHG